MPEPLSVSSVNSSSQLGFRQKILVVSWSVPPIPYGSATIVDVLSRQFTSEEMVLAGEIYTGPQQSQRAPGLPQVHGISRPITWPKRGTRFFRWLQWRQYPGMVKNLVRIIHEEKCTHVLGVFPDELHLAAARAAARKTGIPLIPYFHNTYLENRTGWRRWQAKWLQPRIFREAPFVLVMSDGMREYMDRQYPGVRFIPLVHSFDEPIPEPQAPPTPGSPLRLAILGNVNETNDDALRRITAVLRLRGDQQTTFITGTPKWFLEKHNLLDDRSRVISIPHAAVAQELPKHDIMLLPHGLTGNADDVEYRTIFPTRTIPYLISGRPILAHSPSNCFLTRWLKQHDCAEVVEAADEKTLLAAIDRLTRDEVRRNQLVRNAIAAAVRFHAPVVAAQLRQLLREVRA